MESKQLRIPPIQISSLLQSLRNVQFFATPWTTYCMPGFPVYHQLPEVVQTHVHWVGEVIQSSHPCHPLFLLPSVFPSIRVFPIGLFFASGGQSIRTSVLALVLPTNIQDLFPLGLTGLISLQFRGLSRVFSNITIQKHQFFGAQLS